MGAESEFHDKEGARELEPTGRGTAKPPFDHDPDFLGSLRPDQVPRFLGALTDPASLPTKTFDLKDLIATQDRVSPRKVRAIAAAKKNDELDAKGPPLVVRHNGKHFIADGHHRLAGEWLAGEDKADAAFKDLTPVSQAMKSAEAPGVVINIGAEAFQKDGPSASDVHVDAPLGGGKKPAQRGKTEGDQRTVFTVCKVDEGLGLVFGWGIICKNDGVDYYDVQGDHIPEERMLEAVTDFMERDRDHGDMHVAFGKGMVVHSFPLTTEIAKEMGISCDRTGWMVATKPTAALLAKFKSGEYKGFSIGGDELL